MVAEGGTMTGILDRPRISTARLLANIAVGILALIVILGAGMNACADRLSRQLDNVDPTAEEMTQNIPFGGVK
jgi:hypothetical protein